MKHFNLIFTVLFLAILLSCKSGMEKPAKPYQSYLSSYMQESLNLAVIHDGFSPPVASRIYAYTSLVSYEAFHADSANKMDWSKHFKDYSPKLPEVDPAKYNAGFATFVSFVKVAKYLVYSDFVIDTLESRLMPYYRGLLDDASFTYTQKMADSIANQVIAYAAPDGYLRTRSAPLYNLKQTPDAWQPTPPLYGTAIEPHWGEVRTFLAGNPDSLRAPYNVPFDSTPGSPFYKMAMEVYETGKKLTKDQAQIALRWDGDPMPPYRLKHLNVSKRQLNPVGHWVKINDILCSQNKKSESFKLLSDLRVSVAGADALIVCWANKYHFELIRPHTYINRYIDKSWDPLLATPPFPEYPSGHSVISGATSSALIQIHGDIPFTDNSTEAYGFVKRHFNSISEAASECAMSRVYGGVHFREAVEEGVKLGNKIGDKQRVVFP